MNVPFLTCDEVFGMDCNEQHELYRDYMNAQFLKRPLVDVTPDANGLNAPDPYIWSGFYRDRVSGEETDDDVNWNHPYEPLGSIIIGRPKEATTSEEGQDELGGFGMSIAQSGGELIISAPYRDAIPGGNLLADFNPVALSREVENSGVAYLFTNTDLWSIELEDKCPLYQESPKDECPSYYSPAPIPPKPHMYAAGGGGHGRRPMGSSIYRRDITFERLGVADEDGGLHIAGRPGDRIQNIIGIPDFNDDTRSDFVVSAPMANDPDSDGEGDGAVYVVFRRSNSLEGDYVLDKLALDPTFPNRLSGIEIIGNADEQGQLGAGLAGGNERTETLFDFNDDEIEDIAIGSPTGNGKTGEVLIVFGTNQLLSPAGGIAVDTLLDDLQGALITGVDTNGLFGFNIANAGDIDGDGLDDLLIAAPNATPRFDSTPTDSVDKLDTMGLDRNFDGLADDVTGPTGIPDLVVDEWDRLEGAGLVYVIFGSADTTTWLSAATGRMEISIDKLGTAELPGFIIVGRRGSDQLGGGDAHSDNIVKHDPSRSRGLAGVGDVDGDNKADFMIGSIMADPRIDPMSGVGTINGGEAYLIYGFERDE